MFALLCDSAWLCPLCLSVCVRVVSTWMPNSRAVLFDRVCWSTLRCRSSLFSFLAAYSRDKTQLLHQYLRVCRCILRVRVLLQRKWGELLFCVMKKKIIIIKTLRKLVFLRSARRCGNVHRAVMIDVQFDGARARIVSGIILNICFHLYAPG